MTRALTFAHASILRRLPAEYARSCAVCGCALALIAAGPALPFIGI